MAVDDDSVYEDSFRRFFYFFTNLFDPHSYCIFDPWVSSVTLPFISVMAVVSVIIFHNKFTDTEDLKYKSDR